MSSNLIVVPLLADKVDDWKQWVANMKENQKAEYEERIKRLGLTRERVWLQQTPDGGHLVTVLMEGDDVSGVMEKFATSEHPFDVAFRNFVGECHGIDFSKPPPPPPDLDLDISN